MNDLMKRFPKVAVTLLFAAMGASVLPALFDEPLRSAVMAVCTAGVMMIVMAFGEQEVTIRELEEKVSRQAQQSHPLPAPSSSD